MPINPNIALSFKPTYELESPQNIEANVMKLQGAKYANELARMQSQEYARGLQEQEGLRNYLAGRPDLSSQEARSELARYGKPGSDVLKAQDERTEAENKAAKANQDIVKAELDLNERALNRIHYPEEYSVYIDKTYDNKILKKYLEDNGITKEQALKKFKDVVAAGPTEFKYYLEEQKMGMKSHRDMLRQQEQGQTGLAKLLNEQAKYAPGSPEHAWYQKAITNYSDRTVNAAPTLTTIVDPENPDRMINVNARTYAGGGANAPGVIGVSGKEPTAVSRNAAQEAKTAKVEEGKARLADDLENLRESFRSLDKMKAIPSTSRNAASNVLSGLQSTDVGQAMGKMFGTKEQVERDVINSARSRLVNAIKNATGMSAQQLNSNVELRTMLDSISTTKTSVESAMRIIDDIDNAYVKGTGKVPGSGKPSAPGAPAKPLNGVVDFGSLK